MTARAGLRGALSALALLATAFAGIGVQPAQAQVEDLSFVTRPAATYSFAQGQPVNQFLYQVRGGTAGVFLDVTFHPGSPPGLTGGGSDFGRRWTLTGTPTTPGTYTLFVTISGAGASNTLTAEFTVVVTGTDVVALTVADVAGDNVVNIAERAAGFGVSGTTETGASVLVSLGPGNRFASVTGTTWRANVAGNDVHIAGTSVLLNVTARIDSRTTGRVSRALRVDLVAPTATYAAPASLATGRQIARIDPGSPSADVTGYAVQSGTLPPGLTLDPGTGAISGTPSTVNANPATVTVRLTDSAGNTNDVDVMFPAVSAGGPTATWAIPASLTVGVPIAAIAPGSPSTGVTGYAVQSGTLPPGLTLNPGTGVISGTPTAANASTATVTVRLTDSGGDTGDVTVTFPAVERGARTLNGFAYSPASAQHDGTPPTVTAPTVTPALPSGSAFAYSASPSSVCAVDSGTGALTLAGRGTCTVTVTVPQTANYASATESFAITVTGAVGIAIDAGIAGDDTVNAAEKAAGFDIAGTTEALASVSVTLGSGSARSATVSGTAWTVTVPANDPEITGTSVEVVATATLSGVPDGMARRTLTVDLAAPTATWTAPASLAVGEAVTIAPSGAGMASYAVQSGALPPGLTLNADTGVIAGTPTEVSADTPTVVIRLTDSAGNTAEVSVTFPAVGRGARRLVVTYDPGSVRTDETPRTLDPPTVTATPPLPESATVSYSASPPEVCTVDSGDGELMLARREEAGICTVTATASQTANYDAAMATATVTVTTVAAPEIRTGRVNEAALPHVAGAMAAGTLSAIAGRVGSAAAGVPPARLSSLADKPNLLDALRSGARDPDGGAPHMERLLGGSSFVLAAASAGENGDGAVAVWGAGDWRRLSGPDDSAVDWDGNLSGFHLGADVRLRPGLLAGVAVSRSSGSFDYTDRTDPRPVEGSYETRMTGVHPYVSWSPSNGPALWATVGYGAGEIGIAERNLDRHRSDTSMWTAAAGASHELASDDRLIEGGTAKLRLKGEGSAARIEVEGAGAVRPAEYDVRRLRVTLEGAWDCLAGARDGCLAPSLEAGLRHDGGDATTGFGVEVGGGLRWTDRASGLTVEGRGRVLVADADDREDWGLGGLIRIDPGSDGRGLSFALTPGFGDAASGVGRLYDRDPAASTATAGGVPSGHVETEIGYGFGESAAVVVTPYGGASLGEAGARNWHAGVRLEAGPRLGFGVEGTWRERRGAAPDQGVMARGRLRW